MPIKGLRQPVEVCELRGATPASRLQSSAGALTRFLGREEELAPAGGAAGSRRPSGQGQVVAVVGEAGVGKSRLVWEFTRSTAPRRWLVLEAPAVSYGKSTPYAPDDHDAAGVLQDRDGRRCRARIRAKVTARLLELDPSLHWAVPAILSLGNIATEDAEWEALRAHRARGGGSSPR